MADEIRETPAATARLLDHEAVGIARIAAVIRGRDPQVVITCARGSSDNAAAYFKYLTEILIGVPVASIGPSVASLYRAPLKLENAVIVSVSQSGQSPDIVSLQAAARRAGAFSVAVVNQGDSPLAQEADAVIPLHAGSERSVAATKSCISSAVALAALVAAWSDDGELRAAIDRLPASLDRALEADWDLALATLSAAPSAYMVGRGPGLPIAAEAALKLKETAEVHAEAFSGAEVMHGPLQLLRPGFPVIAFSQMDATREAMSGSIVRLRAARARVFEVSTEAMDGGDHLAAAATGHVALDPITMLLAFYSLSEKVSRLRGCDPDMPSMLQKVTETI